MLNVRCKNFLTRCRCSLPVIYHVVVLGDGYIKMIVMLTRLMHVNLCHVICLTCNHIIWLMAIPAGQKVMLPFLLRTCFLNSYIAHPS